ncbi:MAG TPA: hypothetical protein VJY41_12250 [Prolixibacteraceae bacterium]|nr:hypothetical protein [Prolixibacteraceae bacterium]
MKRTLIFTILIVLLSACGQVYFTTPQPTKGVTVKSFIADLQGFYADSTLEIEVLKNELLVKGDTFRLSGKTPDENEVLVKYYKKFYFASFVDSQYFSVYMANFYDNKLAVYMLNADAQSITVLNKFLKVDTLNAKDEHYLINPSKKEFDQLVDYELFEVIGVLEKQVK